MSQEVQKSQSRLRKGVLGFGGWLRRLPGSALPAGVRFERRRRALERWYDEQNETLDRTHATSDERRDVEAEYVHELRELEYEQESAFTRDLLRQAHRLRVPVPDRRVHRDGDWVLTEYWEEGPYGPYTPPFLSRTGIATVRQAIREEEKWRIEKRRSWLPWVAALTGLVGAVTGLLAVFGR